MPTEERISFSFESEAFAGVSIRLRNAYIRERMNEPYVARADLIVPEADADIAAMIGKTGKLIIERPDGGIREIHGIVTQVELGEPAQDEARHDITLASVVLVPAFWQLSLTRHTKIFQEMSAIEILEEVLEEALGAYGRELRVSVDASYPTREYCVQYQESDLAFAQRLIEEEGIAYAFDNTGDAEVLVLRDRNPAHPETLTQQGGKTVRFYAHDRVLTDEEPIIAVRRFAKDTTTSVVVNDFDWSRATMPFDHEERSTDPRSRDRESYEHGWGRSLWITDYSGTSYGADDKNAQAKIRQEAHARDAITIQAASRVIGMAAGTRFELANHPTPGLDGEYLVLEVVHRLDPSVADQSDEGYVNVLEAIPVDTQYRPPRRSPKPAIPSIQTAVVTGPAGEEIHVDEHGRIKVQFHWDRYGANDENSSCWIRVRQPWGGAGWGHWYVPRIGMEVVVHFLDGDADRPAVTGCVYDGTNPTPYGLPDEKTKSTIKSNSSLGGDGSNEFRYEDKKGEEEIYTHAEKDYNEVVENDHNTLVHNCQTNEVDVDQTQTIHQNQIEQVDGDQEMTVTGNRTVHVKTNFDETVDGTETRQVDGDVTETFDANETRDVTSNVTETIGINETRTIGGDQTETIGGDQTRTITGSSTVTVTAAQEQTITGGVTSTTPAAHTIIAVAGFSVTTPAQIKLTAPAGAAFIAPGGFTQMDNKQDWMGTLLKEYKLNSRAAFAVTMETVDMAFGFTNTAVEVGGMVSEKTHFDLNPHASKLWNSAVKAYKATKVRINGITTEG